MGEPARKAERIILQFSPTRACMSKKRKRGDQRNISSYVIYHMHIMIKNVPFEEQALFTGSCGRVENVQGFPLQRPAESESSTLLIIAQSHIAIRVLCGSQFTCCLPQACNLSLFTSDCIAWAKCLPVTLTIVDQNLEFCTVLVHSLYKLSHKSEVSILQRVPVWT